MDVLMLVEVVLVALIVAALIGLSLMPESDGGRKLGRYGWTLIFLFSVVALSSITLLQRAA